MSTQNKTKTIYLERILNGTGICIKDEEITSITEISSGCKQTNEVWLACAGSNGDYNCTLVNNNTQYKISGLRHSGIKEQSTYCGDGIANGGETCSSCPVDVGACPPLLYCGDGICNNGESCSSCSADCGVCSPPPANSGGGGGGGGGGAITPKTNTTTTTSKTTSKQTTTPQTPATNKTTEQIVNETVEGKPAGITGGVIGVLKGKVFWAIAFIVIIVGVAFIIYNFKIKPKKSFQI